MKRWKLLIKGEKGFTFMEVIISIALFGIIGITFAQGLSTTSKVLFTTDIRQTANNLAASQMESIKNRPYAPEYTAEDIPPEYDGFDATITTLPLEDENIQRVLVTIDFNDNEVLTLEDYMVR